MSEAPTISPPASLYPDDGGAAAAAAALAAGADTTAGADTSAGGSLDTITAGAGADTVAASAGADTVAGNDTILGNDTLAGNDTLSAESYQFNLPEGFTENAELQTDVRAAFLDAGVNPAKAQALIDLFGKAVKASTDASLASHTTEQQGWLTEINAMPEFQGPTRETSLQAIGRVWDEFGTPEAKAAMNRQGVGNNPALVKMFLKIAQTIGEGRPAAAGRPAPTASNGRAAPKTIGGSLYPDQAGT